MIEFVWRTSVVQYEIGAQSLPRTLCVRPSLWRVARGCFARLNPFHNLGKHLLPNQESVNEDQQRLLLLGLGNLESLGPER